jgi:large subunit ribosomal protein L24
MTPEAEHRKFKIRKNDMVMVITGRDRGKTGKVLRVIPGRGRLLVERLNMVKRHTKPRGAASPGGIVEREASLDISNVMVMCDRCNAPVRIRIKFNAHRSKSRVCRRCGDVLGE